MAAVRGSERLGYAAVWLWRQRERLSRIRDAADLMPPPGRSVADISRPTRPARWGRQEAATADALFCRAVLSALGRGAAQLSVPHRLAWDAYCAGDIDGLCAETGWPWSRSHTYALAADARAVMADALASVGEAEVLAFVAVMAERCV